MLAIALFELRRRVKLVSTWVYFGIYFALAFIVFNAAAGAFDSLVFSVGGGGKVLANAPHTLAMMLAFLSYTGVVIIGSTMGQAVYQDFAHGTHTLFFTAPISQGQYLGGRFLGAYLTLLLVFSSLGLGAFLASLMPWLEPHLLGPNRADAYLWPYLTSVLPNVFFMGALCFGLAALTRRIAPVYVTTVVLLIGYLVSSNLLRELETKWLAAVLDPFGLHAAQVLKEYWTVEEKNTLLTPLRGVFLLNRAVWTALGAAFLAFTFACFQRTYALPLSSRRSTEEPEAVTAAPLTPPVATRDFRPVTYLRMLPRLTWLDLKETVKNVYFLAVALAGVLFVFTAGISLGTFYGTTTWPVTYEVLEQLGGTFSLFHIIIIAFYAGELVWRERDAQLHGLMDALPTPTWLPYVSKLLALMGVQVLLSAVLLVCGLLVQVFKGYYRFELGLYAVDLFGLRLWDLWLLCVIAVLAHVLVNHKYMGHFVMVLYILVSQFAGQFGFEHNLYNFGFSPTPTYSDMNGYGPFLRPMLWFKLYWGLDALAVAFASNLLWVRGAEEGWRWRLKLARERLSRPVAVGLVLSLVGFTAVGLFIFHNTNRLNRYVTQSDQEKEQADYEKQYRALAQEPQPRIVSAKVQADLFPEEARARFQGTFGLENRTSAPVTTVYVNLPRELRIDRLVVAGAEAPSAQDTRLGFHTYRLPKPLAPGEKGELQFDVTLEARGFRNSDQETRVVENGTFVHSTVLPRLGYQEAYELSEDNARKRHGLEPKERMAGVNDTAARMNTYIATDSDWIDFEATVSTSPDQVALAPGYLQREWTEGGRRHFHYTMDAPILNFYSFLSARYAVRRDRWNDVAIEVLYHPGHEYNVARMIEGVKASLDYYTRAFGPYQHRQVRILEFPRYARFAQSFPNTIPYSEGIGFIAKVDPEDPEDVDYPYYVTAHEVAHQWWAHQVIGGNVQGATVMSETLSQYSALMVMKKKYGKERMGKFLRYELDRYLMGRSMERKKELPLALVEGQPYIHYNKGSLIMYALQDYLGEDTVNQALASYLRKTKYQKPPYTHSPELLAELRAVTPAPLRYLIGDFFERITLYENRALQATATERPDGKYEVLLKARASKVEADALGKEQRLKLDDWVDVGVLDDKGQPLYLQKHHLMQEDVELTLVVDGRPARAGLDPLNMLIDRKPKDNTVAVELP